MGTGTGRRARFLGFCASVAACLALLSDVHAYESEYRLSSVLGTAFPWGQAGERWAELVREKTQGRIRIRLYSGASLVGGDQTREFTAVQQGVIDLAIGSTINWSPQVKELNLFSLPFLMPDYRAIDALTHGEVGRDLFAAIEAQGVVPLAWGENGFRELSNSRRPIKSPADMKGMKFRVVGSPIFADVFGALEAKPVLMSWADAQPALASGTVDGQENPLSIYHAANMAGIGQKYLTLWHYVADPLVFAVNKQVWNSWTPEDREAVRLSAQQAAKENIEKARKGLGGKDRAMLDRVEAAGGVIATLSDEQRQAFVKATRGVYDKWAKIVGTGLVAKAEKAVSRR